MMSEAARERARIRAAEWRKANPERLKAQQQKAHAKRKDPKRWRAFLAAERERYRKNREAKLARQAKFNAENPARRAAVVRRHHEKNPAAAVERVARRKAKKLQATPEWADRKAIRAFYVEARALSERTGVKHEVDHIIPLQGATVCGLHVPCNLQVIPRTENRRKATKLHVERGGPWVSAARAVPEVSCAQAALGVLGHPSPRGQDCGVRHGPSGRSAEMHQT